MIASLSTFSAWSQSALVGIVSIPLIFLATGIFASLGERLNKLPHARLRFAAGLVHAVGFGVIVSVPLGLHLSLIQSDFLSWRLNQLALPWLAVWSVIAIAPLPAYALVSKNPPAYFQFAVARATQVLLAAMLFSSFWALPLFALNIVGLWDADMSLLRFWLLVIPFAGFVLAFIALVGFVFYSNKARVAGDGKQHWGMSPLFYLCAMLGYASVVALYAVDFGI